MITKMDLIRIDVHIIWMLDYFSCFLKTLDQTLFLLLIPIMLDILVADNSLIDKKHLKKYPFCGKMQSASKTSTERIVNSETVLENYRWVVRIKRYNLRANGRNFRASFCSGSIITER